MSKPLPLTFGFQASPASDVPKSDRTLYREVIEDCELGHELGFKAAWVLEHHFSDYFPSPNPLLFMANIARAVPELELGTAVLVLPWHQPLRVAEEIAMLNNLTESHLHVGMGRGTAKSEYDAFQVNMGEARARFAESADLIRRLLTGEKVSHAGEYFAIDAPVQLRPKPDLSKITLYGAIGSPASAPLMAKMGLPPICTANFPLRYLDGILSGWRDGTREIGGDVQAMFPISIRLLLADTDEEAQALGRKFYPPYFEQQYQHYATDGNAWKDVDEYKDFSKFFGTLRKLADPEQLGPYMSMNLIGSSETVSKRLDDLVALGFNHIILSLAIPGTPTEFRREQMQRFAMEIAPRYAAQDVAVAAE